METIDKSKNYRGELETQKVGGLAVVGSGEYTTYGGSAVEVASISDKGIEAGDKVIASVKNDGTSNVTLIMSEVTADNQITFTFSADPVADTIVTYLVIKA